MSNLLVVMLGCALGGAMRYLITTYINKLGYFPYGTLAVNLIGSFFKIRDITLGYTFKPELLKHLNLSRLRVYATAKNFFTFSKIDNYDPEQGGSISFPMTKQLVFGLNVEF